VSFDREPSARDEAALRATRLPPGWDEAVRLDEDPATVPDPAAVEVPADLRAEIEASMAKYPDRHSAVLPALDAAQRHHGWCSPEALRQIAAVMQVTPAYLSSVATFYDMLRTRPAGSRYVYVCTGVACHPRNAKAVYRGSRTSRSGSSSASARVTWRRWRQSTAATSARSTSPMRPDSSAP
jgi:NADH:ubiquinone oxidoreductase subunit E